MLGLAGRVAAVPPASPDAEEIRRHTFFLGSDACEGRAPGSPGSRKAAAYIAAELARNGIAPLGEAGGYFQPVPMHGSIPLAASQFLLITPCGTASLAVGEDVLLHTSGHQTLLAQPVPVTFAGYGITAPEYDYNDYAGLDVRGRVVAVLEGEPPSRDPTFFGGALPTLHATLESKRRNALARGALGCLLIPDATWGEGTTWAEWQREYAFEHISLEYSVPNSLFAVLAPRAVTTLFCGLETKLAALGQARGNHTVRALELRASVRFRGRFRERDFLGRNVIARLPGSDPLLGRAAVVVAAHYDHLGVGPPVGGRRIYNGVVDNAMGVAVVLEVARALAALPDRPRRSIVFLFTDGEERGLLGASHYTNRPPVPLPLAAAMINVDGVPHQGPFTDVVGLGGELSTLGVTLRRVATGMGLTMSDVPSASLRPDLYRRSDQMAFAEAGIPAIQLCGGVGGAHLADSEMAREMARWGREIYHSPADNLTQPLDFETAAHYARLVLAYVVAVANDPTEPRWRDDSPYGLVQRQERRERR